MKRALVARLHTKRRNFLALEYGLHGRTFLTMNVTGIPMWRADDFLDQEVATFIPRPYDPAMDQDRRSPFPGCIGECARRETPSPP